MSVRLPISEPVAFEKDPRRSQSISSSTSGSSAQTKSTASPKPKESGSSGSNNMITKIFGRDKNNGADDRRGILSDAASIADSTKSTGSAGTSG